MGDCMKFCERVNYIKPKTLKNCYRIIGNKAYFQERHDYAYYCIYEDSQELKRMQYDRIKENMKSGGVDDWECCDTQGMFSYYKKSKLFLIRANKDNKEKINTIIDWMSSNESLEHWQINWLNDINNFDLIKIAQFKN